MSYYYGMLAMVGLVIKCTPKLERDIVFQQLLAKLKLIIIMLLSVIRDTTIRLANASLR